jgi:hypothetical protein
LFHGNRPPYDRVHSFQQSLQQGVLHSHAHAYVPSVWWCLISSVLLSHLSCSSRLHASSQLLAHRPFHLRQTLLLSRMGRKRCTYSIFVGNLQERAKTVQITACSPTRKEVESCLILGPANQYCPSSLVFSSSLDSCRFPFFVVGRLLRRLRHLPHRIQFHFLRSPGVHAHSCWLKRRFSSFPYHARVRAFEPTTALLEHYRMLRLLLLQVVPAQQSVVMSSRYPVSHRSNGLRHRVRLAVDENVPLGK